MKQRGQILILAFIMVLVVGILAAGVMQVWESQKRIPGMHVVNQHAFYAAQSGIELAKAQFLANVNYSGSGWQQVGNTGGYFYWSNVAIVANGIDRDIIGFGEVRDSANHVLAHKEISMNLTGVQAVCTNSCTGTTYTACTRQGTCPCTCWDGSAPTMTGSNCRCGTPGHYYYPCSRVWVCPCTCPCDGSAPTMTGSNCRCPGGTSNCTAGDGDASFGNDGWQEQ